MNRLASSIVLLAALWALSCSVGGAPVRVVKGQQFSLDQVSLIEKGMTATQVKEVLGEPLVIASEGNLTRWRYFFRERKDDVVRVLGIFPVRRAQAIWETEADVLLVGGLVQDTQVSERRIK